MKKKLSLLLAFVLLIGILAACGKAPSVPANEAPALKKIKVGASVTPHSEILEACREPLAKKGFELEIKEFTDYILPNTTLQDKDLDANYFQHLPYLEGFNKEHKTDIVSVLAVHYEPMGIYPGTCKSLADLKEGDKIAVPNDGSNEARALLLLQAEGLIKLKDNVRFDATVLDITENPKKLEIVELDAAQIAISLPDVALGVVNGNYALQANLSVTKDALASEKADSDSATTYANILCVRKGDENTEATKALIEVLGSKEVKDFIAEKYKGAVVALG
ncbi:MAG: ABC transporter substrate-binding protein [Ruminococcaceae bacterium]|nr:ABC transporter substrate-binding protein [Oscillospiraceae bacterium]